MPVIIWLKFLFSVSPLWPCEVVFMKRTLVSSLQRVVKSIRRRSRFKPTIFLVSIVDVLGRAMNRFKGCFLTGEVEISSKTFYEVCGYGLQRYKGWNRYEGRQLYSRQFSPNDVCCQFSHRGISVSEAFEFIWILLGCSKSFWPIWLNWQWARTQKTGKCRKDLDQNYGMYEYVWRTFLLSPDISIERGNENQILDDWIDYFSFVT